MAEFPKKLSKKLDERKHQNSFRTLTLSNDLIDFSSNDYLGFASHHAIFKNASKLLLERGFIQNGATGSRLISGNHSLYVELENYIAKFHSAEAGLVFNSGYDANVGFFSAVPQRGDIIFYDEFIHASIRDGIVMSAAKGYKFKHNNLEDLKTVISRVSASPDSANKDLVNERPVLSDVEVSRREIYVVTESVFSMDGDTPNLKGFADFCSDNKYHFVVDEAHAVGVFGTHGQGLVSELVLQNQVFAQIITFGKAMGCHGAAILGSQQLKDFLVNFARSFIYTTGLPPHSLATLFSAYNQLHDDTTNRNQLVENIQVFKEKILALNLENIFISSDSAVHCCMVSGNENVKQIAVEIQNKGFDVKAILSPTVPKGQERLRFCLHSYNTKEEIQNVLTILKNLITE